MIQLETGTALDIMDLLDDLYSFVEVDPESRIFERVLNIKAYLDRKLDEQ